MRALLLVLWCTACAKELELPSPPPWYPARLEVPEYAGASACRPCHLDQYAAWERSPHGRAMTGPVLGAFDGAAVAVPGGEAVPFTREGRFFMKLGAEVVEVARVIGSGRQHQVYLDAEDRMLPLIWITVTRAWLSSEVYQRASVDPASPDYWRRSDTVELGCPTCHLSQGRLVAKNGRAVLEHTDLSINCESCHGPGRKHLAAPAPGDFPDLKAVPKEEEVAVCAGCHARKSHFYLGRTEAALETLIHPAFRADGTQRVTAYQTAGHLLSACYLEGAMRCSSCHEPHAQTARDLTGEPATHENSDKQCTVCHRNLIEREEARRHARHDPAKIFCVNCHMPFTWMFDDPEIVQKVSDHSVSIPRPTESLELGLPNACTTCHEDQSAEEASAALEKQGARRALEVRPWVRAIARAKLGAPAELAPLLTSTAVPPLVRWSALEGLIAAEPSASLIPELDVFWRSEVPAVRALALRALYVHDPKDRIAHRTRALADPSPRVRIEALLADEDGEELPLAAVERVLEDLFEVDTLPPADELLHLADLLERNHRHRAAERIVDFARTLPRRSGGQ